MLRRTYTMVLAVTLLFTIHSFSQTYQGPQQGSVSSGAIVNTNSFPDFPISGESDPIVRGERNIEGINNKPIILESDGKPILPTTYVEDQNILDNPALVGDNSMLLSKWNLQLDNSVIPPDPTIAVGPNHVMVLTNNGVGIRIYDKQGMLLKSINSDDFWSAVWPTENGDPQIFYDHYSNRWFMLFMQIDDAALTAGNLIAYSDDDDPLGTWYAYRLDTKLHGTTPSNTWGDYPQIGFDQQGIYVMTRCFNFSGGFDYTKLRIISKSELYASNAGPLTYRDIWDITIPGSVSRPDVIHPSFQYTASGEHYLLFANRGGANFYSLYKITNPITAPVLTGVNIGVPYYGMAPDANQLGGGTPLIATNGSHMKTAPVIRDGFLYATHSIQNSVYPFYSSTKYFKINIATNTVVESAELGADKYFYLYPAIAVDKDGNVGITCSRSGDSEYIGSYFTTRRAIDPPGLSSARVMEPGLGNYIKTFGGTRNRWGDYLGVFLDPADEYSFWMVSEFASATNTYDCVIGQVRLQPFAGIYAYKNLDLFDFGTEELNTFSDTADVIISNYGTDPLIINSIALSQGDFYRVSNHTFPITINTFDSIYVKFVFNPTSLGQQTVTYPIANNSGTFSSVDLKGFGYQMSVAADLSLYALSGLQNGGETVFIDKTTGLGNNLGNSNYTDFVGMAVHPVSNQIYAVRTDALNSQLYRVNGQTGDAYFLKFIDLPNILSIAFDNTGSIFATTTVNEIYQIDFASGSSSLVSTLPTTRVSIAFNPLDNQLWGSVRNPVGTPKDRIVKINLLTGDTTRVGQTGFAVNTNGITFSEDGKLYGIKGTATVDNDLILIDTLTAIGTLVGSTGLKDLRAIGYSLVDITSLDDNSIIYSPDEFVLEQNYPNPFNPSTQIKFSLPINSNVKIIVYNLLGEVVRELANREMNSGVHSIQWNAEDASGRKVTSGIYFYELNAAGVNGNQFNQVRKMILLK